MDNATCVIVGVEATDARPSGEISSARKMIADCVSKLGLTPQTLAADTGYGKSEFLAWLESHAIASYIPLRQHFASTSGKSSSAWTDSPYRSESNSFECREGKELKYIGIKPAVNKSYIYRSTPAKCRACPVKNECTSGRYKQIVFHVEEAVRQRARERTREAAFSQHQRSRRKIEALFGELKNRIGLRRVRLRRLKHVREQFLMAAAAQNLKRLVPHLASGHPGSDNNIQNTTLQQDQRFYSFRIQPIAVRSPRVFQQLLATCGHDSRKADCQDGSDQTLTFLMGKPTGCAAPGSTRARRTWPAQQSISGDPGTLATEALSYAMPAAYLDRLGLPSLHCAPGAQSYRTGPVLTVVWRGKRVIADLCQFESGTAVPSFTLPTHKTPKCETYLSSHSAL
jgi:hypothetical protein